VIPLTIMGLTFHNVADWLRKALHPAPARHEEDTEVLTPFERVQHALLFVTFAVLAYSGFALKWPETWWASPFTSLGGELARKFVHRWTALVFVLGGLVHLVYMLGTRRGRSLLRGYFPNLADARTAVAMVLHNLGIREGRPVLSRPSYIQKLEYWGLIWGSLVMAATGTVLAFNDLALKWLPGWGPELATTVHWFEAILAASTIVIWHAYWVVLDPDVYPMNWAWLTGRERVPPKVPSRSRADRGNRRDRT
jgi:cytochrome b subunit of formate dehydrogenase